MSAIQPDTCAEPGPYEAHCTDYPGHHYSCYDASEDVSFNHRQDFHHKCSDPLCTRQELHNEGD